MGIRITAPGKLTSNFSRPDESPIVDAVFFAPIRGAVRFLEGIEYIKVRNVIPLGNGELLHRLSNAFPPLAPPAARVHEGILDRQHGGYRECVLLPADVEHVSSVTENKAAHEYSQLTTKM